MCAPTPILSTSSNTHTSSAPGCLRCSSHTFNRLPLTSGQTEPLYRKAVIRRRWARCRSERTGDGPVYGNKLQEAHDVSPIFDICNAYRSTASTDRSL